jgi:hypothetical protein
MPGQVKFPDGTVRCEAGDHLLRRADGGWQVYRVQDVVALTRLVVLKRGDEPVDLVPELPDSVNPAHDGPHLLLAAHERLFDDREDALSAIADRSLGDGVDGICRALAEFPVATTDVVRGQDSPG